MDRWYSPLALKIVPARLGGAPFTFRLSRAATPAPASEETQSAEGDHSDTSVAAKDGTSARVAVSLYVLTRN